MKITNAGSISYVDYRYSFFFIIITLPHDNTTLKYNVLKIKFKAVLFLR